MNVFAKLKPWFMNRIIGRKIMSQTLANFPLLFFKECFIFYKIYFDLSVVNALFYPVIQET